ncbi:flagellar biosynthesis anti-sigma factor FlgM [Vibrio agarivorans]|jgi:flagellar biosynthesis anti-sigma factor FlgM|uniref:flagellar biosynthesis anti-sigma factor FlgM n=1 Tax=Vibrio agarivorans TaxID=153622 RepID=UPI0022319859|nr:flagellar biosynthesis anti-sigma factor FlgM [Vibrio agarivorans]MDN3662097.1 flagellar biosynthesis anti-sigma factor FlgM [Vibrio agarivorans]
MKIGPNTNPSMLKTPVVKEPVTDKVKESSAQPSADVTHLSKVSQQARELESLQQELHDLPDVDLERVNQIRAELKQGDFKIDLDELAGAIFNTHQRDS